MVIRLPGVNICVIVEHPELNLHAEVLLHIESQRYCVCVTVVGDWYDSRHNFSFELWPVDEIPEGDGFFRNRHWLLPYGIREFVKHQLPYCFIAGSDVVASFTRALVDSEFVDNVSFALDLELRMARRHQLAEDIKNSFTWLNWESISLALSEAVIRDVLES